MKKQYNFPRGLAHVVEHCVFEGDRQKDMVDDLEKYAGNVNAGTSYKETFFEVSIHNRYLENGLQALIAIVSDITFTDKIIEQEKKAVLQEFFTANNDERLSYTVFIGECLGKGYDVPVIGDKTAVSNMTLEDVQSFYQQFYVANNMTLTVVGDFEEEALLETIVDETDEIPQGTKVVTDECDYKSVQYTGQSFDPETSWLSIFWPVYGLTPRQHEAVLYFSNNVIAHHAKSILYKEMREDKGNCYWVKACYENHKEKSIFSIDLQTVEENVKQVSDEIIASVRNLEGKISLERFKDVQLYHENSLDTVLNSSDNIMNAIKTANQWGIESDIPTLIENLKKITLTEYLEACQQIFSQEPSVIILSPNPKPLS